MTLFQGRYRVESSRLREWDYAAAGWYFVTICTRDRALFFGNVMGSQMRLSPPGEIAGQEWQRTEQLRPNVTLDEWVVMPNHLHGVIVIRNANKQTSAETPQRGVSTPTRRHWKPDSLGAILNQFKSACTKRIRAAGYREFGWQPRFYDHIIRDEESLLHIREHIRYNPVKWDLDEYNPANRRL